jgi:hypothetical protein
MLAIAVQGDYRIDVFSFQEETKAGHQSGAFAPIPGMAQDMKIGDGEVIHMCLRIVGRAIVDSHAQIHMSRSLLDDVNASLPHVVAGYQSGESEGHKCNRPL